MAEKFIVAKVSDIQNGQKKRVKAGETVLMLARVEDKFFAVQDACTHNKASLSAGYLHGYRIECGWHGAQFDLRTGEVKALPAARPLKTYPVEIDGENIVVMI